MSLRIADSQLAQLVYRPGRGKGCVNAGCCTPVDGGVRSWWYLVVQRTSGKLYGGANVREAGRIKI